MWYEGALSGCHISSSLVTWRKLIVGGEKHPHTKTVDLAGGEMMKVSVSALGVLAS